VKPAKKQGVSKRDAFLAAFRATASVTRAAEAAGIERQLHYRWLEDEDYSLAFDEAKQEAAQTLEDEAIRRAHEGILEPVIYQGQVCYEPQREKDGSPKRDANGYIKLSKNPLVVRKQSDALLTFLLKGHKPEKYRESFKGEITTSRALTLTEKKLAALTDDELAALTAIAEKLTSTSTTGEGSEAANTVED
jgi:hypothetical protein